jgi:hypothetical protein
MALKMIHLDFIVQGTVNPALVAKVGKRIPCRITDRKKSSLLFACSMFNHLSPKNNCRNIMKIWMTKQDICDSLITNT